MENWIFVLVISSFAAYRPVRAFFLPVLFLYMHSESRIGSCCKPVHIGLCFSLAYWPSHRGSRWHKATRPSSLRMLTRSTSGAAGIAIEVTRKSVNHASQSRYLRMRFWTRSEMDGSATADTARPTNDARWSRYHRTPCWIRAGTVGSVLEDIGKSMSRASPSRSLPTLFWTIPGTNGSATAATGRSTRHVPWSTYH